MSRSGVRFSSRAPRSSPPRSSRPPASGPWQAAVRPARPEPSEGARTMEHVAGAVAAVAGGASGIGRGLATSLLERGASAVVLADVEKDALDTAVAELSTVGDGVVVGVPTDVTDPAAVEALADAAWDRFGG